MKLFAALNESVRKQTCWIIGVDYIDSESSVGID